MTKKDTGRMPISFGYPELVSKIKKKRNTDITERASCRMGKVQGL
ncbi:MAG: hypothetical protein ACQEP5_04660 [Actinomycetota bacterium]